MSLPQLSQKESSHSMWAQGTVWAEQGRLVILQRSASQNWKSDRDFFPKCEDTSWWAGKLGVSRETIWILSYGGAGLPGDKSKGKGMRGWSSTGGDWCWPELKWQWGVCWRCSWEWRSGEIWEAGVPQKSSAERNRKSDGLWQAVLCSQGLTLLLSGK